MEYYIGVKKNEKAFYVLIRRYLQDTLRKKARCKPLWILSHLYMKNGGGQNKSVPSGVFTVLEG